MLIVVHWLYSEILKVLMFLEVYQRQKTPQNVEKMGKRGGNPFMMANPKLVRALPKSIIHTKKQVMAH